MNILLFSAAYGSFALILTNTFNIWQMWFLSALMGFALAGVGLNLMHEANHGVYNPRKWLNYLIGSIINLMGSHKYLWDLRHNTLHHVYTNVIGVDYDMVKTPLVRLTTRTPRRWFHKYQHFYCMLIYINYTIIWIMIYDWIHLVHFYGTIGTGKKHRIPVLTIISIVFWKAFHLALTIYLPYVLLDIALWQVLIGWVTMHWLLSAVIGVSFQLNHTMEGTQNAVPSKEGRLAENWSQYMLKTSFNFSTKNRLITYFLGGLNFQIEHHLFPNMSYTHYYNIAPMIKEVLQKYGITYNDSGGWLHAVWSHLKYLKRIGQAA